MAVMYCDKCDKVIDLDQDAEHFSEHEAEESKLVEYTLTATVDGEEVYRKSSQLVEVIEQSLIAAQASASRGTEKQGIVK